MLAPMALNLAMMISMTTTEILFTVANLIVAIALLAWLVPKADKNIFNDTDNDKGEELQ